MHRAQKLKSLKFIILLQFCPLQLAHLVSIFSLAHRLLAKIIYDHVHPKCKHWTHFWPWRKYIFILGYSDKLENNLMNFLDNSEWFATLWRGLSVIWGFKRVFNYLLRFILEGVASLKAQGTIQIKPTFIS